MPIDKDIDKEGTEIQLMKANRKVMLYNTRIEMIRHSIPMVPPRALGHFSISSIFRASEDLPERVEPMETSMKLTKGEVTLLSHDPKYSICY